MRVQPDSMGHTLLFDSYQMSDHLEYFALNYKLVNERESWNDQDNLPFCGNASLLVHVGLPKRLSTASEIISIMVSRRQNVELDEDGAVICKTKQSRKDPF